MALPTPPKNPTNDGFESSRMRRSDPFVSFEDITAQSAAAGLTNGPTRGIMSKAGGTVAIQGMRDASQTTVQLNAGVVYWFVIGAFTLSSANDLQALR